MQADLIVAMKERDADRALVLRTLKASLKNAEIAGSGILDDAAALAVLQREAKRHAESIDAFSKAGRVDLVDKEKKELVIIQAYLPAQMSDDELHAIVEKVMKEMGSDVKEGVVIGKIMSQVRGKADGKRVQIMVKSVLSSS